MTLNDVINYYKSFTVTSPWNENRGTYRHKGVDLAGNNPDGKPVYAMIEGVVLRTGYQASGAGHYIVIGKSQADERKTEIKFFHLKDKPLKKQGQRVQVGDILGYIGSTGNSTGSHLHIERWENGKTVNPLNWLEGLKQNGLQATDFIQNIDTQKSLAVGVLVLGLMSALSDD